MTELVSWVLLLIEGSGSMVEDSFLKEETDDIISRIAGSLYKLSCISDWLFFLTYFKLPPSDMLEDSLELRSLLFLPLLDRLRQELLLLLLLLNKSWLSGLGVFIQDELLLSELLELPLSGYLLVGLV